VWRIRDAAGRLAGDRVALEDERPGGKALLQEVMRNGRRLGETPALTALREHCRQELAALPAQLRALAPDGSYPVDISSRIRELAVSLDARD